MAYKIIANEILRNPDIINQMPSENLPINQIRTSIISDIQREIMESQGIDTLKELADYPNIDTLAELTELDKFTLLKIISSINLLLSGSKIHKVLPGSTEKLSYLKIVFFGLDNAGKTSLIQFIKKKEPLTVLKEHLPKTRPTVGVDYQKLEFQEIPIILQELGGQTSLRENHIKNVSSYFKDSNLAVFVIDSNDTARIDEALKYFKKIYYELKDQKYDIPVKIAIHKTDSGIVEASDIINKLITKISQEMQIPLVDLMNSVYATTIKDLSSISSFFSNIMEESLPIRSYVTVGLSTLISLYPLDFCCLIDPTLSRIPLGWVTRMTDLDPKTIVNYILEYTENVIQIVANDRKQYEKAKLQQINFTITINNMIKELVYLPVYLEHGNKEYYFVFSYQDSWEDAITPDMPDLEILIKRALEPQLELALLAINSQEESD